MLWSSFSLHIVYCKSVLLVTLFVPKWKNMLIKESESDISAWKLSFYKAEILKHHFEAAWYLLQ